MRHFGQHMVDDHTKARGADARPLLEGDDGATALDAKHQAAMQKMSRARAEFDKEYAKMMVADHKKTVGEFQKDAGRGADPDIRRSAAAQLPALQGHLQMAQRLNDKIMLRKSGHLKTITKLRRRHDQH